MKKIIIAATAALAGLASLPAMAAATLNANSAFNVNVTLNTTCTITTAPVAIAVNYTSGSATLGSGTTSPAVTCTNGVNYTLALSTAAGLAGAAVANPVTNAATGLQYNLNIAAGAAGAGAASTVTSILATGNGAAQTYTIGAYITGPQAGTCTAGTCAGTDAYFLNVNY